VRISRHAWYPPDCLEWNGEDTLTLTLQTSDGKGVPPAFLKPNGEIRLHWRRTSPGWSSDGEASPAEAEGRLLGRTMAQTRNAYMERSPAE
jgi:hypothetical protein